MGGGRHGEDKVHDGSQAWVDEANVALLEGNLTDFQDIHGDEVEADEGLVKG